MNEQIQLDQESGINGCGIRQLISRLVLTVVLMLKPTLVVTPLWLMLATPLLTKLLLPISSDQNETPEA